MPARRRRTGPMRREVQRHSGGERNDSDDHVRTGSFFYAVLKFYLLPIAILAILILLLVTMQYSGNGDLNSDERDGTPFNSEAYLSFLKPQIAHLYLEFTGKPLSHYGGSEVDCSITLSRELQKDPFALRVISLREAAKCAIMLGITEQSGMPSAASSFADRGNNDPRLLRLLEKSTLTKQLDLPVEQIVRFEKYYELKE